MYLVDELAAEHSRSTMQEAERIRPVRRLRALRRAHRMERKAEQRLIEAWQHTAEVRRTLEPLEY
jgi:hypothetical protein